MPACRTSVVSCAKWKKSLKRGLLVEQYLVVKALAPHGGGTGGTNDLCFFFYQSRIELEGDQGKLAHVEEA